MKPNKMLAVWAAADRSLAARVALRGEFGRRFSERFIRAWVGQRIRAAIESKPGRYDITGAIIRYEAGEMEPEEIVEFFQVLVSTGAIRALQGSYQRVAWDLVREGLISTR